MVGIGFVILMLSASYFSFPVTGAACVWRGLSEDGYLSVVPLIVGFGGGAAGCEA